MIVLMTSNGAKKLTDYDPWLEPYEKKLVALQRHTQKFRQRIVGDTAISEFALGYDYFGLHRTTDSWVLREWAPNATAIYLHCEASDWADVTEFVFTKKNDGQWELELPLTALKHEARYKLHMYWDGGSGYRVPAWANYVVQDPQTNTFDAVVWAPTAPYAWQDGAFTPSTDAPMIYEAHVGMSGEAESVNTYKAFARDVLPRIKETGYNTVQLMAVAEHPYYGSFGYHVSSYFAPSSRFGTPDDLRALVDEAHRLGLRVIMDIVHSHAVKNEVEGISRYDGSLTQFFHKGPRGHHEQWDSRVFDYGKPEVTHFLLSNCRYWLDEFHMDGFRFDGVTSMLYTHHGLERSFTSYDDYFAHTDNDATAYLTLANQLIHEVKPGALTVAEDMSGMPGLAGPIVSGGLGFDYRLSMGVPDLWIKYVKELKDEQWHVGELFHQLIQHRPEERTINYAESHDQALVGDKTLMFRLADKEIYDHMMVGDDNLVIDRAIALHKLIRLLTASTHAGGYLNFMGNEFGHPEWIDFPREGNDWSYKYARRQWKLRDNMKLKYHYLAEFDHVLTKLAAQLRGEPQYVLTNDDDHVVAFTRGDFLFVFNFHPTKSFTDYGVKVPGGNYTIIASTDGKAFGGFGRIDTGMTYPTVDGRVKLYLPARTAIVLSRHNGTIAI